MHREKEREREKRERERKRTDSQTRQLCLSEQSETRALLLPETSIDAVSRYLAGRKSTDVYTIYTCVHIYFYIYSHSEAESHGKCRVSRKNADLSPLSSLSPRLAETRFPLFIGYRKKPAAKGRLRQTKGDSVPCNYRGCGNSPCLPDESLRKL